MIDAELFSILKKTQTKNDAWVRNLTIMNMSHDYPSIAIRAVYGISRDGYGATS